MLLTLLNLVVKSEMNLMLNAHETNRFIFEKKRKRRYEQGQSKIFIQKYFLVLDDNNWKSILKRTLPLTNKGTTCPNFQFAHQASLTYRQMDYATTSSESSAYRIHMTWTWQHFYVKMLKE
jgi:hypothetical protein